MYITIILCVNIANEIILDYSEEQTTSDVNNNLLTPN